MPTIILGKDAKLYQGAALGAIGTLTEVSNIKDASLTLTAGEADVTTRANAGWRAKKPTLRECSVDFVMMWDPADASFIAIRTAFLAGSPLELAILDQDRATPTAQGPKGQFSITGFTRSENLEEGITVSVTAKMTLFEQWHTT